MDELKSASQQLALALFEEYAPNGDNVTKAPNILGFRRSNAFTKIVDLSLAARRLVDVAYFLVAEDSDIQPEYRVDFDLFRWLLCTTSSNRAHLKKIIREAQQAAIELNEIDINDPSKDRWGAVPLMGPAFVTSGQFIFELPERLQRAIKNPTASHFLSLRYVFKSIHSKVLFDRLQPYMAEGLTPWFDIQTLRAWLECEKKTYDLFKHFRNKVLEVAIAEIGEVTGTNITILTNNSPGSKRIAALRFKINTPPQPEQKTALIVLRSMYDTLRNELGLSQRFLNEIIANRNIYTDERIQQAIEYTRHAAQTGTVKRASAYFMKALREGYILGRLDKKTYEQLALKSSEQKAAANEQTCREEQLAAQSEKKALKEIELGWELYHKLSMDEQAAMLKAFSKSATAKLLTSVLKIDSSELGNHLSDGKVRGAFGSYVAKQLDIAAKASSAANRQHEAADSK